ncbi:MAG: DUF4230 domain-containing protein [Verrucomicrobiales bacterium]
MKSRLPLIGAILLVALGLGLFFGVVLPKVGGLSQPKTVNTSIVIRQIQGLSELVTVKYVLEKVVVVEDVKWYGENRILVLAHGVVKAGVDLSELKDDQVVVEGKKITLTLPREKITDAYLDEKMTQVIERSTGVIRQFDKDLEQNARVQAVDDLRRAARYNGIMREARERAEMQVKIFLLQAGFEQVDFKSIYK